MARITLDHIRHAYNAKAQAAGDYALKEVHHEWEDGGAYALLGPSGCGKTTLLNIISGLLRPSEGRIAFDGTDVTDLATEDRNIAQVFQFPVVYDTMTVYDNLAFPLRNRHVPEAEVDRRVQEILEMTDLSGMAKRRARGLTADQKQKISLARGLVRSDVNAILFDEPLTVIDPHMKWVLRSQLKRLHRQSGFTMVYVTHDQTEALTFADKVVVMPQHDRLHARAAHLVDGRRANRVGNAGGNGRLSGRGLPLPGRKHTAHQHIVNIRKRNRSPLNSRADRRRTEIGRGHRFEFALEPTHSSTGGPNDHDRVMHSQIHLPWPFSRLRKRPSSRSPPDLD